ncbi:xanthine dehydrogenase family protein molybdopterin-binding subunit [Caballeronia ptereochthonis]|uniref:Aldehyde oxidase n=1 Tax=Caballeronia ptereochthonis TaxID=1777144 RepID=A0A157ZWT7_9BURK|nr:molybdopterin cofactor-binding domain-containing protein [Caballeronia ptereochthonis]SAK49916.1 aldehyde oxidase [Caballeronia ptereochthonis]
MKRDQPNLHAQPVFSGRRRFLQTGAALAGGLLLEIHAGGIGIRSAQAAPVTDSTAGNFAPNAWVRITPDNRVLLVVHKFDSGTGVKNALGLMLAEELDADWDRVRVIQPDDPLAKAYLHPLWGMHATGGSTSVSLEWDTLRRAGATARAMLVAEAARRWSVDQDTCRTSSSTVFHPASGRKASYGDLAQGAAAQPVPAQVALKRPDQFVLIGKERRSYRVADKVTGRALYAIDVELPGMLTAIVIHPPVVNASVKSFNASEVKALPGVRDVFAIEIPDVIAHFRENMPPMPVANGASQPGVAIVADHFWAAQRARQVLKVEWGESDLANFNSDTTLEEMKQHVDDPGKKSKVKGDADTTFGNAPHVVEAVYSMPYKAHAQMEPLSVVAWVKPDVVEYWGGIQVPSRCAQAAQTIAGVRRDKVRIHLTEAGGSFGAREGLHQILEATFISKRMGQPVKLLYSREDDVRGLYYHAASVHKARAALDASGTLLGFSLRAVVPSIKEPDDPGFLAKVPVDPSCTEGMRDDFYYDIPALDLAWVRHEPGFPVWWWRAVSYVPNIFAIESLIDEAAYAAGQDPVDYRRRALASRPELKAVLDRAASLAGWKPNNSSNIGAGRGLGVAIYEGYKSFIAIVADVGVKEDAIKVNRITCVVDCGLAVDPGSVRQQLAGGIYWGVSTALMNAVHIERGMVRESNFHDYAVLRMHEAPELKIEVMPPSGRPPGGIGELSNPPVVPAIGNAIFAATGKRLRATPFVVAQA